jgi:hypothetical protein
VLVHLDDADRLCILPDESPSLDKWGSSALFLFLGGFPVIILLLLKAYLFLLVMSPFFGIFLLLAAYHILASDSILIDRHSGLIVARRRFLRQRASREWNFALITGVQISEGVEYVPRLGSIPEFWMYLVSGQEGGEKQEVSLGKALTREEAEDAAKTISGYTDWDIRHALESH